MKKLIIFFVFIAGFICPFIDSIVLLQCLLFKSTLIIFTIPVCIIILILIEKNSRRKLITHFIIPFIAGQIIGPIAIDNVQRIRSNRIIKEREIAYT